MKRTVPNTRSIVAMASLAAFAVSTATAAPVVDLRNAHQSPVVLVEGDCYAIGQQVAAQKGGTLARATRVTQDGKLVCVIVVLIPGQGGDHPRRTEIVVPLD